MKEKLKFYYRRNHDIRYKGICGIYEKIRIKFYTTLKKNIYSPKKTTELNLEI